MNKPKRITQFAISDGIASSMFLKYKNAKSLDEAQQAQCKEWVTREEYEELYAYVKYLEFKLKEE